MKNLKFLSSRLKFPTNCSADFTKFYPPGQEKKLKEMNPPTPQSYSVGFSLSGFRIALCVPASLFDRLPQALAHRRLCLAPARQVLFLKKRKERFNLPSTKSFIRGDFLGKIL
jgi:hypothetical protein